MNYLNLNHLKKVDLSCVMNNDSHYMTYVAKKIVTNKSINTDGWIVINKLLPINRGLNKNKIVKADIIQKKEIVVKISKNKELLKKDYDASIKLESLKCPNFSRYLGFFSCKDNFNNYNFNKPLPKFFCKNNGTTNYFLFMNYYPLGSLSNFIPNEMNQIISIINQVIGSCILEFEKFGFIHGDLHPGNILCKKIKNDKIIKYGDKSISTHGIQIILFDFDRSNFSGNFGCFLTEISTFINLYDLYLNEKNIIKHNNLLSPLQKVKKEFYKIKN